jgi:hypothetical protein
MFADENDIALLKSMVAHAPVIDVQAVGAANILDKRHLYGRQNLTVMSTDEVAVDLQLIFRSPADP